MSTAVMPTAAFYEFDLLLKNQTNTRNITHLTSPAGGNSNSVGLSQQQQQQQQASNNTNNNNNTVNLASQLNNNLIQNTQTSQATAAAIALQQQLNAAVAAQQAQVNQQHQQQQQKMMLHNALQRAVSHPHGGVTNVVSLVNTLIENLGGGHRKLERTQSEPLPQVNTSRYKTELCRPFEEAGECKYGDKCQFAHGMHELRNLQRHPKYKTELCRTFHSVGFCPYGPRCHFVHNAEEARAHNRAVNAAYARMAAAQAAQGGHGNGNHLPMSPPLSMSTGSDRASPTGSLSLSPTNSMASFFPEQNSPTFPQGFAYPQSPPSSPRGLSPVTTPPPQLQPPQSTSSMSTSSTSSSHQNQHVSSASSTSSASSVCSTSSNSAPSSQSADEARLPVFNRLSSTIDAFTNMTI